MLSFIKAKRKESIKFEITTKFSNFEKKQNMITITAYTKCPKCKSIHGFTELVSATTSGAEFWSDGFCMAPLRMDIVKFGKCPSCNTFFWLQENAIQKPADLSEIKNIENSWQVDKTSNKEIDFIKAAFRPGLAQTSEKELILRINLWHAINHIIRKYHSQGFFNKIKNKFFETAEFKDSLKQYNACSSLKINNLIRIANLLKLDKKGIDLYKA